MPVGALSDPGTDYPTGCTGEPPLDNRFRQWHDHRRERKWGILADMTHRESETRAFKKLVVGQREDIPDANNKNETSSS